jgi:hypothetical protein
MSIKERILLVLRNKCPANVDIARLSPDDLIELAQYAAKQGVVLTFSNAMKKSPDTLARLAKFGPNVRFEF